MKKDTSPRIKKSASAKKAAEVESTGNTDKTAPSSTEKIAAGDTLDKHESSKAGAGQTRPSTGSSIVMPTLAVIAVVFIVIFGLQAWRSHLLISDSSMMGEKIETLKQAGQDHAARIEKDIAALRGDMTALREALTALKRAYEAGGRDTDMLRGVIRDEMGLALGEVLGDTPTVPTSLIAALSDRMDAMTARHRAWEAVRAKAAAGKIYAPEFARFREIVSNRDGALPAALGLYALEGVASRGNLRTAFSEIAEQALRENDTTPIMEASPDAGFLDQARSFMRGLVSVRSVGATDWNEVIGAMSSMIAASDASSDHSVEPLLFLLESRIPDMASSSAPPKIAEWISALRKRVALDRAIRETESRLIGLNQEDISILRDLSASLVPSPDSSITQEQQ